MSHQTALIGLSGILLYASAGCDADVDNGVKVSGTVTCDETPLSGAVITFEPIGETTGPNASVPIMDGKFEIDSDAGLHGGSYRVRFSMIPIELRRTFPPDQVAKLPPDDSVIRPDYDANSKQLCDLIAGQENSLEFAIEFLQ